MTRKRATYGPNNHSGTQPPAEAQEPAPDFASDEAAEAWVAAGQPPLTGEPSGKTGFTKADVLSAAEEE